MIGTLKDQNLEKDMQLSDLAKNLYFTIALIKECNYKCEYCYPFGQNKVQGENMNEAEAKQLIDAVLQCGFNKVKLTGGEPTLVPWFENIVKYIIESKPDVSLTIITNGSTLKKHIDLFESYKNNIKLQFSLDSTNPEHKKARIFKILTPDIKNNLIELSKRGISTRINMVVTKENKDEINKIIDLASELKFSVKIFNLFFQDEYIATDTAYGRKNNPGLNALDFWKKNYVNLNEYANELKLRATREITNYSGDGKYGISYGFVINDTEVLLADTTKGAYYQNEICIKQCPYFRKLCEKGFYNPHVSSNLILYPDDCYNPNLRWELRDTQHSEKVKIIQKLLGLFKDVSFVKGQIEPIAKQRLVV